MDVWPVIFVMALALSAGLVFAAWMYGRRE
jgi:hypothetical protein